MGNTVYSNFFLSNEVEDQFNSHLDLQRFCKIDTGLVGTAGMKRTIHKYSATSGTQKLTQGNGNTQSIEVAYTSKDYDIILAQNRFKYFDEEAMKDPYAIPVGVQHCGTDMFNTVMGDIYTEFKKAEKVIVVTSAFSFGSFADGQSMLNLENLEGVEQFAFVSPKDVADLRKALKDDLKYVEAFARSGYIGTVAGVNLYTKKDATKGTIILATKDAVTMFIKKGTEIEQERDANTRENTVYSRKYYLAAFTDARYDVKLVIGSAALSTDTTVSSSKKYFEASGLGYVQVTPASGDNPVTKGWYEITETSFS